MSDPGRLLDFFAAPNRVGLDEALLTLAACRPGTHVDVGGRLAELDAWAEAIEARSVDALRVLVYDRLDFRGDLQDYHDPANSDLDAVMRRRTGMPITLASVLLAIARRAGIPLEAVGMPGHFLVRDPIAGDYLDPFDRARPQPASALHARMQHLGLRLAPDQLAEIDDRLIVTRVVNNLTNSYLQRDTRSLDWLIDLRLALPLEHQDARALVALCEQRGRFAAAADILERLATAAEGDGSRRRAHALRARLN
ncbi:MAG: transglutaminase-like domain-containing protein [Actinomycetota bacterium]